MENITTKLKTQFAEEDTNEEGYFGFAKKILHFAFRSPKRSIFALALVGILAFGGFHFLNKLTPEEQARKELGAAVVAVEKLMILPQGDEPVLATVTDADALTKQQAFFAGAVNGDQLLLFPRNLKAVLYSPSRKMIVNVGPIQQQPSVAVNDQVLNSNSQTNSSPKVDQPLADNIQSDSVLTVEVRNGSGENGRATEVAAEISAMGRYEVVAADAASTAYKKTIVVALKDTDAAKTAANVLAEKVGGAVVVSLPKGEKASSADVVIVLGGQ